MNTEVKTGFDVSRSSSVESKSQSGRKKDAQDTGHKGVLAIVKEHQDTGGQVLYWFLRFMSRPWLHGMKDEPGLSSPVLRFILVSLNRLGVLALVSTL